MTAESSTLMKMLESDNWLQHRSEIISLRSTDTWQLFLSAFNSLDRSALYESRVHGQSHIERVILLGSLLAEGCSLDEADTRLLLSICSYHDVGRVNDGYDLNHGYRSSLRIAELTGYQGDDLRMTQAITAAHSKNDADLENTLISYQPYDFERCLNLARIFKDADGLDRVRIADLDPAFMRTERGRELVPFAQSLWEQYVFYEKNGQQ